MIRRILNKLLKRPKRKLGAAQPNPTRQVALQQLSMLHGTVDTMIDVGVWRGTPFLYSAFPDCHFFLVEPHSAGESALKFRPKKYTFVNIGLGSKPGKLMLRESNAKSTLHARTPLSASESETEHEVDIITLDQLFVQYQISGKVGLKIDTEGHEMEVMRGLSKFLNRVEFIICEVSVRDRFYESYNFSELVAYFWNSGFRFFNFMNPPTAHPRLYDVIFLRKDHPLFK